MGNRTPALLTDNEQGSVVTRNNGVGQTLFYLILQRAVLKVK